MRVLWPREKIVALLARLSPERSKATQTASQVTRLVFLKHLVTNFDEQSWGELPDRAKKCWPCLPEPYLNTIMVLKQILNL